MSPSVAVADLDVAAFKRDGYLIVRGLASQDICERVRQEINESLTPLRGPAEFEVDVQYPGAPKDRFAEGASTPRRLLHAYGRHPVFREWGTSEEIKSYLQRLMGHEQPMLAQSHHNCVMTKYPGYSSMTSWHQDNRYWRYDRPELVSVWLAVADEYDENGALQVIPGTHKQEYDPGRLDRDLFLRTDLEENQALLDQAKVVELSAGDVLFFHSQVFHAAGRNMSDQVKTSLVFTYHDADNHPIPATKSSSFPSIPL